MCCQWIKGSIACALTVIATSLLSHEVYGAQKQQHMWLTSYANVTDVVLKVYRNNKLVDTIKMPIWYCHQQKMWENVPVGSYTFSATALWQDRQGNKKKVNAAFTPSLLIINAGDGKGSAVDWR
jgi:hypothetical protein